MTRRLRVGLSVVAALVLAGAGRLAAQQPATGRAAGAAAPQNAQAAAPIDLTGYWVSIVTEDWRWRMIMPAVGDHSSVPLNVEGRRVTDGWDSAADIASHSECKAYGAPGLMRIPGRLHITWQDPNTLRIDTDAGQQTRLFRFGGGAPAAVAPSWQGQSVAAWEVAAGRGGVAGGSLTVETTKLRPGYLRRNGVPYSGNTVLTEYFDRHAEENGDVWLTVVTVVHDPKYLYQDFITSTQFKKEMDASKWRPTPCSIEPM